MLSFFLAGAALAQESSKVRVPAPRDAPAGTRATPQPFLDASARVYPGDMAPDFELDGSQGKPVKLSTLRGDWVALVFTDRIDPIPSLKSIDMDLRRMGARILAVCREKSSRVNAEAQRTELPFLVLADVTGQVGALYGLRDYSVSETRPALLLLDRRGVVKLSVMGQDLSPQLILELTSETIKGT